MKMACGSLCTASQQYGYYCELISLPYPDLSCGALIYVRLAQPDMMTDYMDSDRRYFLLVWAQWTFSQPLLQQIWAKGIR